MPLCLAIRTPLSPPENHMDQYRDTPIRSRDSDAVAARRPIPVFHVKPWEHQEPGPVCFWTPHFRDTARVGTWDGCSSSRAEPMKASGKVSAFIELASAPVFTPRTRSDRWFHVKLKVAFQRSSLLASMTNRRYQRCRHQAACFIDPRGSWWPGPAFSAGGRLHLPLPAPDSSTEARRGG